MAKMMSYIVSGEKFCIDWCKKPELENWSDFWIIFKCSISSMLRFFHRQKYWASGLSNLPWPLSSSEPDCCDMCSMFKDEIPTQWIYKGYVKHVYFRWRPVILYVYIETCDRGCTWLVFVSPATKSRKRDIGVTFRRRRR